MRRLHSSRQRSSQWCKTTFLCGGGDLRNAKVFKRNRISFWMGSPEKGYRSISTPQILGPGTVDIFSYLNIGFFDMELEAVNFRDFMTCKLPRFMMRVTYSSAHISKANFVFVPMMDFKQKWIDQDLYRYFELTDEEIAIIESTMRPLTLSGDNDIISESDE